MAKGLQFKELSAFAEQLQKLGSKRAVDAVMKPTLYEGAAVYANAVRRAAAPHGHLAEYLNLSEMKPRDGWYTRLSFVGYDEDGVAEARKAAALESGTSDGRIKATHFFRKAIKSANPKAQAAMIAKMTQLIKEMMEV